MLVLEAIVLKNVLKQTPFSDQPRGHRVRVRLIEKLASKYSRLDLKVIELSYEAAVRIIELKYLMPLYILNSDPIIRAIGVLLTLAKLVVVNSYCTQSFE